MQDSTSHVYLSETHTLPHTHSRALEELLIVGKQPVNCDWKTMLQRVLFSLIPAAPKARPRPQGPHVCDRTAPPKRARDHRAPIHTTTSPVFPKEATIKLKVARKKKALHDPLSTTLSPISLPGKRSRAEEREKAERKESEITHPGNDDECVWMDVEDRALSPLSTLSLTPHSPNRSSPCRPRSQSSGPAKVTHSSCDSIKMRVQRPIETFLGGIRPPDPRSIVVDSRILDSIRVS